ncbi:uncharacterized protein LOC142295868 isoform X1 [Anomaloglossus baeobatrachus]|uniref:uncharacterized protein LOC142295868 isoform X1 n=1 Tax=Anomaloglossus baeobatrachus TaxID=238106 RepID=UPI003F4FFE99
MWKPQPFTIGTRLSAPRSPGSSTMDISERFSHYLPQVTPMSPARGAATWVPDAGSLVRSISKITLSREVDGAVLVEGAVADAPQLLAKTGNCNNNNSRGLRHIGPQSPDLPSDWSVRDPIMMFGSAEDPQMAKMADHTCRTPPPATGHAQLQPLRDQWPLLQEASTNQSCAVGGAPSLLEFNKKVDELEMWMRAQEEPPPLGVLLDENLDKMQISRKILDLKQEQIHYCHLQETVNKLAQQLERPGRPDSRTAQARCKHLNRMWLRLQTSLHEHEQSLQLALEAASLRHQADAILRAMEEKSRCAEERSRDDGLRDQDVRDIAGQIMMLDVAISQVSNLHPLLSSRALLRQVKERWAQLRKTSRSFASSRDAGDPLPPGQSSVGNHERGLPGAEDGQTAEGPRGPISSRRPTDSKRSQTNHKPQNGHQTQGPPETPELRHLLRELGRTSQWLQDVEGMLSEPTAMRSPEPIRKDLKKVSLLEKEARSRESALQSLRGTAKRWSVTEEMGEKVQEMEERCQVLQDALRRRVSDLRDTLVLSEFMKVVQLEEERKKEPMSSHGAPQSDPNIPPTDRTETFSPLEELQEAVEMLNDAVKERAQALAATREVEALASRVSALSQMMAAASEKLHDVQSQLEAAEKVLMTVRRETQLQDLRSMIHQQQRLEADISGTIQVEVKALEEQREKLQGLCPVRSLSVSRSIDGALREWTNLQSLVHMNKARLQKTTHMRAFLLRYLSLISWTEATRDQVLSGRPRGLSAAQRADLERTMHGKLKAFEALAGIGWKLIGEDHHLMQMVQERLEEVQGLLISWRYWKQQRIGGDQMAKMKTKGAADNLDEEKDMGPRALEEFECPEDEDPAPQPVPRGPKLRRYRRGALSPLLFQRPSCGPPAEGLRTAEEGRRKCPKGPLWLEPKNLPTRSVSPEPQEEVLVSTYFNTKEETQTTYQSLTVPRVSRTICSSVRNSSFPTCEPSPKIKSNVFFRSLLRKERAQRHTIQGIMRLCSDQEPNTQDMSKYWTSTWPPKLERDFSISGKNIVRETYVNYVKNPLSKDINAECGSGSKKLGQKNLHSNQHTVPSSCPRLAIGRVPTLPISKEPHIVKKIQDVVTVISANDSCNAQYLYSEQKTELSANEMEKEDTQWSGSRSWLEDITSSSGYCRQNIHGYGRTTASERESWELEDFIDNFEIDRLSPLVLSHIEAAWDPQEKAMNSPNSLGAASLNCDVSDSQCQTGGATTLLSPTLQEIEGTSTTCSSILHEMGGTFTTSSLVLQENGGTSATSSSVLQETGGTCMTSSSVLQETRGTSITSFSVFQEMRGISTISSSVLQETEGTSTTSVHVFQEKGGTSIHSSSVLEETGGTSTTSFPVLQENAGTSSVFLRNEDGVVDQYCVKTHYPDAQQSSLCSSYCVFHTLEDHHDLGNPYIPIETPHDKEIFTKTSLLAEVLHPDIEFLENDDEELEGIWNNAKKVPAMCPARASHHIVAKEMVGGGLPPGKHDSRREPYGQVVMRTEPNMLVATFTLPSSTMRSTQLATEKTPNTWRANSQASIRPPSNWCPEGMRKSRPNGQTPLPETVEKASMFRVTRKLDFYLMEGPLERKPVLQVGGRKAFNRTWGTFYAVLVRRTLCFYHDHRNPTKSSASASPIHLTGAVCTPESSCTERDHCFRLLLMDGSEYRFRVPTLESLHQWVTALRHSSGMDASLLRDTALASEMTPRIMSGSLMSDLCPCIPAQATDIVQEIKPPFWKMTDKVAAEASKLNYHHVSGRFTGSENDGTAPDNNPAARKRSQSLSSVLYPKVMSTLATEDPSRPSAALYIEEPLIPRVRCHSFAAAQGPLLNRRKTDFKSQNKSVIRKFFYKNE